MPLTAIDPQTALVVIDLQKGIRANNPNPESIDEMVRQANRLSEAFRRHGLPVALVTVDGGAPGRTEQQRGGGRERPVDYAELLPDLSQGAQDIKVTKRTPGAFASTDLEHRLKTLGVTQVVVVGVATNNGVESTARQAYEAGFNVTLPVDAMSSQDQEAHAHSITKIFPRLGETGTTEEVIRLLDASRG